MVGSLELIGSLELLIMRSLGERFTLNMAGQVGREGITREGCQARVPRDQNHSQFRANEIDECPKMRERRREGL